MEKAACADVERKSCHPIYRKANNAVHRLHLRELGGLPGQSRNFLSKNVLTKLPRRLCFSIRNIVDEPHIYECMFFGLSKDGRFLISYSLNFETTNNPFLIYRLQWWHFVPYKKLKKVKEIRLFGDDEIRQPLFICYCEWPTDKSKVLIHGYSRPRDQIAEDGKCVCYFTIVSVPNLSSCSDCISSPEGVISECLRHSFRLNTKYEVTRPYPAFEPYLSMQADNIVMLNTGDSLIALEVTLQPDGETDDRFYSNEYIDDPETDNDSDSFSDFEPISEDGKGLCNSTASLFAVSSNKENRISSPPAKQAHSDIFNFDNSTTPTRPTHRFSDNRYNSENFDDKKYEDTKISNFMKSPSISTCSIHSKYSNTSSGSAFLITQTQCYTYSMRCYARSKSNLDPMERSQSPIAIEDDINLAYRIILPLDISSSNGILNPTRYPERQPHIRVKQLTLDLEQYICETVRVSSWGRRFIAFTDYDVRISHLDAETLDVTMYCCVLIRARPPPKKAAYLHSHIKIPRQYECDFKFKWNIKTGIYTTNEISDLRDCTQPCLLRKRSDRWREMHRTFMINIRNLSVPANYFSSVLYLTNECMIRGKSLAMILSKQHYVAFIL